METSLVIQSTPFFDLFSSEHNCTSEIGFKRRLLLFLQENPFWYQDMRFNISLEDIEDEMELYETVEFELTASRAKYQHYKLANTTIRTTAMQEIKNSMDSNEGYLFQITSLEG